MYFTHKSARYCLNLDWLQFSVHLKEPEPEIMCPEGLRLELCQGNNIFQHRALVYDQRGAKYLTLLWKPYSKVLTQNLMTVQVANEFLYLAGGQGIAWAWDDVQKIVDCTFNSIGRFDICLDWEATQPRLAFLSALNNNSIYAERKSEGSTWWHEISNNSTPSRRQLHCLSWGSPKSEIKVKIYNKSREQGLIGGTEPEKPWIVNQWKEADMDIKSVWRMEFSFAGAGQLRYQGNPVTLDNLRDERWLINVYLDCYHHRFVTRKNEGRRQGHHNKDSRVYLFNLPTRPTQLKWADPADKDYELPAQIQLLRSMMRQIDNPAIMSNRPTFTDYASTILNLIDNFRLHGYFVRTWEKDPQDYFEDLYNNVGQGIRITTPPPARLMD